ncbi:MAG: PHP domain-containing protein, partial [Nanoarchaeota archaeon]
YFKHGKSKEFDLIFKGIPEAVFELMRVPSIGPKKAYVLSMKFNIKTKKEAVEKLLKVAKQGQIASLPNFGEKSEQLILKSLDLYKDKSSISERMTMPYALNVAIDICSYLEKNPYVVKTEILGSLRRKTETVGDIDIAVECLDKNQKTIIEYFLKYPKIISKENSGNSKSSIIINPGIKVDLRLQEKNSFGTLLQYFTGSKRHNIKLREYAQRKSMSISEFSVKETKRLNKVVNHKFDNEVKLYNFLGLQYIPPEIREGSNEIELAQKNKIPDLIKAKDIKGDFHIHSNYDLKVSHDLGLNSYVELYLKAKKLNYSYIGFSDHNTRFSNSSEKEIVDILKKRNVFIHKSLIKYKNQNIDYYLGLEVDILTNGSLALPYKALNLLDYIIVSIHSSFNMDTKTMTKRVITALNNSKVKILAHPTGRLLNKRDGYNLDWLKIFEVCKKRNIALEINSWPERLDLSDSIIKQAVDNSVKLIINSDSHAVSHMDNMPYGVSIARRGWAKKNDIINSYTSKNLQKWIRG